MATVYPINGYDGNNYNPNAPQPYNGNHVGAAYPPQSQPSTGYAPGYFLPPGGATYPGASPGSMLPPGQQPAYPPYNSNMPPHGTYYPPPQGYGVYPASASVPGQAPSMAAPYPGYENQPGGVPYGTQAYPGYGAPQPGATLAYPTPPTLGSPPVVMYPMAVAHQGTATSDPASHFTMRKWSTGLFSCCDSCVPNCCMAWCCPCVSLAQIYARLGLTSYKIALVRFVLLFVSGAIFRFVPVGTGTSSRRRAVSTIISASSGQAQPMAGPAWYAFLVLQQIVLIASIALARRRTRHRFKIPGNRCLDGLVSCFCPCCTIAQVATHIRSYKHGACDFVGPDVLPPFI